MENNKIPLDLKDRKILYQLDLDSRQSMQKIAKKIGMTKEAVAYRINRLIKRGVITSFFTEVNAARFGYTGHKLYIKHQNMTDELETEIHDYLKKLPQTAWVVSCTGRYDAIYGFWAKNVAEFNELVSDLLNRYSKYIFSKEIAINVSWTICNRKWLLEDVPGRKTTEFGGPVYSERVDDKDSEILAFLTKNSKEPIINIAKSLRISPSQVIYRIRNLTKRKIIVSHSINLDLEKLNYEFCKVLMFLQNITGERFNQLIKYCEREPSVTAIVPVIAPWDLELELEVENFEHLTNIMNKIRREFGDIVRNYESCIITTETGRLYIPKI